MPDGTALDRPAGPCPCGCVVFWWLPRRGLLCGRCHPPASGVEVGGVVDVRPYLLGAVPRVDRMRFDPGLALPEPSPKARKARPFSIEEEKVEYETKEFIDAAGNRWSYRERLTKPKKGTTP